jgi:FMN phosphatase YigB (HAD superfamily)
MKLLERFPVVLFDLHGVLMFGHDRFSDREDFHAGYRAMGGRALSAGDVRRAIRRCFEGLLADCERPERYDDFLSVSEALRDYGDAPESEVERLTLLFALHECGLIPDACADLLSRLARSHRLGLVTNVWAPKFFWLREFERTGVSDVFRHLAFSSDGRSVKPSATLFREALVAVEAEPEQVLFVGDSLRCDMEGAKRVGMHTAYVSTRFVRHDAIDYTLESVLELEHMTA